MAGRTAGVVVEAEHRVEKQEVAQVDEVRIERPAQSGLERRGKADRAGEASVRQRGAQLVVERDHPLLRVRTGGREKAQTSSNEEGGGHGNLVSGTSRTRGAQGP